MSDGRPVNVGLRARPEPRGRRFTSRTFGDLPDNEENRLAARAADEMGWPYSVMTGAGVDSPGDSEHGLTLRFMARTRYDARRWPAPVRG